MKSWQTRKNLNKEKEADDKKEKVTRHERVKEVFRKEIRKVFPSLKQKTLEERVEQELRNYILRNQGRKTLNYWYKEKPSETTDFTNWETKTLYMRQVYEIDIDSKTKLNELQSIENPKDLSHRLLNPIYNK